jgi:hypothetical protein
MTPSGSLECYTPAKWRTFIFGGHQMSFRMSGKDGLRLMMLSVSTSLLIIQARCASQLQYRVRVPHMIQPSKSCCHLVIVLLGVEVR